MFLPQEGQHFQECCLLQSFPLKSHVVQHSTHLIFRDKALVLLRRLLPLTWAHPRFFSKTKWAAGTTILAKNKCPSCVTSLCTSQIPKMKVCCCFSAEGKQSTWNPECVRISTHISVISCFFCARQGQSHSSGMLHHRTSFFGNTPLFARSCNYVCTWDTLAMWSFKVSEGSTEGTESNSLKILKIPNSAEQSTKLIYHIYFKYLSPVQTYHPSSDFNICCDWDAVQTFQVSVTLCQWQQGHLKVFMYISLSNQSNHGLRFNWNYNFIWLCSL